MFRFEDHPIDILTPYAFELSSQLSEVSELNLFTYMADG
jgi:hypothetical protein